MRFLCLAPGQFVTQTTSFRSVASKRTTNIFLPFQERETRSIVGV